MISKNPDPRFDLGKVHSDKKAVKFDKDDELRTKHLRDYVDNAAIGLHWVDVNGFIIWANKAELDMLGYSEEEYIGHSLSEFHVYQETIDDILKRLSNNETLNQYEADLRCKDGSIKTVQITSNVFWNQDQFIHTRCFTIDITEQKKLLNALKESESRYKSLIESLDAPLYMTDADGRVTMFNKAAAELWGREPNIGSDLWCGSYKIYRPDGSNLPLDECPMAICLQEQRPIYGEEILVVRPDGGIRNVAPHPKPIHDSTGKMIGAINMLIDITDIKQTEYALRESEQTYRQLASTLEKKVEEKVLDLKMKNQELKASEERYHRMIDEVEDYAIILLDNNGIIQNWNKGAEKIKGYKEEEIVGESFKKFYLPEDVEVNLPIKLLNEAKQEGKAIHEGWRRRKDGTKFWASTVLTALHDTNQNVIGFSKVTRDLTVRKVAEDRLMDYSNQLKFQNEELEQFAYAASHDMKEPLRKIQIYNSAILNDGHSKLSEKATTYFNRSIAATNRLTQLIDDLLNYSRTTVSAGNYEEVDLTKVIKEIIEDRRDDITESQAKIEFNDLPIISGVPFLIKQLMANLIDNALKYKHAQRSALITISCAIIRHVPESNNKGFMGKPWYKISVKDNGIGFDQKYADKIFDIFQRLNNQTSASGSGIGLAICKRIVQNHKGVILARGDVGEGATFDIYFPIL